jgi:hypothetical protein
MQILIKIKEKEFRQNQVHPEANKTELVAEENLLQNQVSKKEIALL